MTNSKLQLYSAVFLSVDREPLKEVTRACILIHLFSHHRKLKKM